MRILTPEESLQRKKIITYLKDYQKRHYHVSILDPISIFCYRSENREGLQELIKQIKKNGSQSLEVILNNSEWLNHPLRKNLKEDLINLLNSDETSLPHLTNI